MSTDHQLLLPGLDGSNPLAFLAALGTWRVTAQLHPGTRLSWTTHASHWSPLLHFTAAPLEEEKLVVQLYKKLREGLSNPLFRLNKDLKIPADDFRKASINAVEHNDFDLCYWMSAIGSEANLDKYGNIQGTRFDLMNAGKQYFLQTILYLAEKTSERDLKNTLFEKWTYSNVRGGMRWDLDEDRRYALRWKDPQSDTTESQWGANRLGIEALPLLQTFPTEKKLETTCFRSRGKKETFFTWPVWKYPISICTCRSLLGQSSHSPEKGFSHLTKMGAATVYRSQRIWKGNPPNDYSNFCPAVAVG